MCKCGECVDCVAVALRDECVDLFGDDWTWDDVADVCSDAGRLNMTARVAADLTTLWDAIYADCEIA